MVQIGTDDDRFKIYIVTEANEPPASDASFTEYTNNLIGFKVIQRVNKLWFFEGKFTDITSAGAKADFREGNTLYVLSKRILIGKFVIEKPEYDSDYNVMIKGIQSTGTSIKTSGVLRRLVKENLPAVYYRNINVNNVLDNPTTGRKGILVDNDTTSQILTLDGTDTGGTTQRIGLQFDNANRIDAVAKAAVLSEQEWWVTHGTNNATPFSGGDVLHMTTRKGSDTSQFTFYIESSGDNQNAIVGSNNKENENLVNVVVVQGHNLKGEEVTTQVFEATGLNTKLSSNLDSWLRGDNINEVDISTSTTTITVRKNSYWESLTPPFIIRIDREFMKVTAISSGGANITNLTVTRGYDTDLVGKDERKVAHKSGSDVVLVSEQDSLATTATIRVTVDSTTGFPASGSIRVGDENIAYSSKTATTFTCLRIGTTHDTDSAYTSYAHGNDINVYCYVNGVNTFTPSSFDTSTTNSIRSYGIHEKTYTENSTLNQNSMDQKAQAILASSKEPIYRITLTSVDPFTILDAVELGDDVTINDGTSIDYPTGGPYTSTEARVMGLDIQEENMLPSIVLYLNQPGMRVFEYSDPVFSDNMKEKQSPEIVESTFRMGELVTPISETSFDGNIIPAPDNTPGDFYPAVGTIVNPWTSMALSSTMFFTTGQIYFSGPDDVLNDFRLTLIREFGLPAQSTIFNISPGIVPGSPESGDIYVKASDNLLYYHDGTTEYGLTGGGSSFFESAGGDDIRPSTAGTDIIPKTTGDLGSTTVPWDNIFTTALLVDDGTQKFTLSSSGAGFLDLTRTGGGDFTIGTGAANINVEIEGTLLVHQAAAFNGDVTLGTASGDHVFFNAEVQSHIKPSAQDTYDLGGSPNTERWRTIYVQTVDNAAYCESNLLVGTEKETGITWSTEGMVLVWSSGKLMPCEKEYDTMVQATATDQGRANVMGAEPILVIGPVSEGDYLVASSTLGHAMRGELSKLVPGCVIAQALESFTGEKGKVKAMIRKF